MRVVRAHALSLLSRLARDDRMAEQDIAGMAVGKAEHVGRMIAPPKPPIERPAFAAIDHAQREREMRRRGACPALERRRRWQAGASDRALHGDAIPATRWPRRHR